VGAGGFGEGDFLADHGDEGAVGEAGAEGGVHGDQIGGGGGAEGHAADVEVAAMVRRGSISTLPRLPMTTTRPWGARRVRSLPRLTLASISRMRATAGARGDVEYLLDIIGLGVVQDMVGALFGDELFAAFAAGGADDGEAGGAGELDGGDADAAGGAVDEEGFAGLGAAAVERARWAVP